LLSKYLARFSSERLEGAAALPASTVEESDIDATGDRGVDHNCAGCLAAEGWDNGALSIFYRSRVAL
jgi:hypothetical protein